MSQELLYTSAPEGLNPSDQGFCTVACTQGMLRNLKEVLENLSGYRQAEQPPHPVNYSHLIQTVGGKRYQILSRVSDYEKDYSGRTNKLAHHIALTMDELPSSGPVALFNTPLFQTEWDGQTRWIPQGPAIPVMTAYRGPCRTWEAITGDGGWAGILAESAADGSPRPMYVIFSPAHDTLALVAEALGVLPSEKAWTTSFSTYFTKLPAGVDCLWRFVLEGTPEARQARAASLSQVIDLPELERSRRKAPDNNPYVEAAREGRVVAAVASPARHSASASDSTLAAPTTQVASVVSPFASTGGTAVPTSPFGRNLGGRRNSSKTLLILAGVAGVVVIGIGVLAYSLLTREIPPSLATSESELEKQKSRPRPRKPFLSERQKKDKLLGQKTAQQAVVVNPSPPEPLPMKVNTVIEKGPKHLPPWDRELAKRNGYLPLPEQRPNLDPLAQPEPVVLTEILVSNPNEVDLTIHSPEGNSKTIADSAKEGFIIETEDDVETNGQSHRRWVVKRKGIDPTTQVARYPRIGTFELADQRFTFFWETGVKPWDKPKSLRNCVLEIHHAGKSQKLRLSDPQTAKALTYDLSSLNQALRLDVNSSAIAAPQFLFVDLTVAVNGQAVGHKRQIGVGESATFPLERNVEFEFTFQQNETNGPFLVANTYVTLPAFASEKAIANKSFNQLRTYKNDLLKNLQNLHTTNYRLAAIPEDFNKFKADATVIQKTLDFAEKLTLHEKQAAELQQKIELDPKDANRTEWENQLKIHQAEVKKYERWIDVVNSWGGWADDVKPRLEKLAKNTKVGYSIYTLIDGQKLVLAQSDPLPVPRQKPIDPRHTEFDNDLLKVKNALKDKSGEQTPKPPNSAKANPVER